MTRSSKRRSKSREWAKRQAADPYAKRARSQGYASRAVFKLEQIDRQDRLLKAGARVIDLGAAPGGWSQYAMSRVGDNGVVIAVDLLPVEVGCTVIQGDFRDAEVLSQITDALDGTLADLVISDMAPNITGVTVTDEARFEGLLDMVMDSLPLLLRPGGKLVIKLFEGRAAHGFRARMKPFFEKGQVRKPEASRSNSREFYMVYVGFRPPKGQSTDIRTTSGNV